MVTKNAPAIDLSVIIVSYNVSGYLNHCLDSVVRACQDLSAEIIVVDNSSMDNTVEMVKERFPQILLIENSKNMGYTRANNQGLALSRGRYVLFLNPDTILPHHALQVSIDFLEKRPDAGLMSLKLVNTDGSFQAACRRGFPTPLTGLYRMVGLSSLFPRSRRFGQYNMTYLDENEESEVDAVCGAFMMGKGEVLRKIKGFDETFFMYGEDIDICFRVKREGFKVFYHPGAEVIHFKGESSRKNRVQSALHFYNSMFIFSQKYFGEKMGFLPKGLLFVGIFLNALVKAPAEWFLKYLASFIDLFFINAALYAALNLSFLFKYGEGFYSTIISRWYLLLHGSLSMTYVVTFLFTGLYSGKPRRLTDYWRSIFISSLLFFSFVYFIPNVRFSRIAFTATCAALFVLLPGWRFLFSRVAFRLNTPIARKKRFLIIGNGDMAHRVHARLLPEESYRDAFTGFVRVSFDETEINPDRIIGDFAELKEIVEKHRVNEIILASANKEKLNLVWLINYCAKSKINLKMVESIPGQEKYYLLDVEMSENIIL